MAKPRFYTAYNNPRTEFTPTGNGKKKTYHETVDENGKLGLVEDGEKDIYAEIQTYADSCNINSIIQRMAAGDPFIVNQIPGDYMDVSEMPTTIAEAQRMITEAKAGFDQLPMEIRKKFDLSPEKYIAEYGTMEWLEKMGMDRPQVLPEGGAVETNGDQEQ